MKHKLLIAAAASALMAAPSFAHADDHDDGWYLRGNLGYGVHTDMEFTREMTGDVESEGNAAGSVGFGYDFGNNWRMELDGNTLWSDLGAIDQVPASFAKLRTNTFMLNALYDFNEFGKFQPYVGAGVGIVQAQLDAAAHDFTEDGLNLIRNPACGVTRPAVAAVSCDVDDTDAGFGWQLIAGLGYAITDNLTWDTHYKYLDAQEMQFNGNVINGLPTANEFNTNLEDVGAHTLLTGFRYRFGGSTPPPPPPPLAPTADYKCWDGSMVFNAGQCPAEPRPEPTVRCWDGSMVFDASECAPQPQTYTCWDGSLVYDLATCPVQTRSGQTVASLCGEQYRQEIIYYEFDKGQSAETRNTINRILDIGDFCNVDNIRVVGHTDTSGAASYNLALSKRRAKDAMDELVRQGVDRTKISSEGKGETEPFVQTGDGVKEQLNRRTEVLITLGSVGAIN